MLTTMVTSMYCSPEQMTLKHRKTNRPDDERISGINSIDVKWCRLKHTIKTAVKKTIGREPQHKRSDRFDKEGQHEKHGEYKQGATLERQTKLIRSKKKKQKYMNDEIFRLNGKFSRHNLRSAYKFKKRMATGFQPRTIPCLDADGNFIEDMEQIRNRSVHYFPELPSSLPNIVSSTKEQRP